jgi:hypothetical protein
MVDGSRFGKVVHGGAVLVAATGSSRGTEGGATRWLDGSGTRRRSGGDGREEERLFTGGRAPFIAGRGGGRRVEWW